MPETKLIVNLTRGEAVCVAELADRPLRRMRGLMGRRGLPSGEGMLIRPAPAIHMAFMRFSIDALFLDEDLQVLEIVECLRPWRVASKRGARAVLELSAGESARRRVQVGDRLELRERTAGTAEGSARSDARGILAARISDATATAEGEHAEGDHELGSLSRMRPLHVLVVSADGRFRTVVSLLLTRRNCSVTTTANIARVSELIARERADVVVIEDGRVPAAETVATVDRLPRPVGIVLVADAPRAPQAGPPTLAKWGPFDELLAAIEQAGRAATNPPLTATAPVFDDER